MKQSLIVTPEITHYAATVYREVEKKAEEDEGEAPGDDIQEARYNAAAARADGMFSSQVTSRSTRRRICCAYIRRGRIAPVLHGGRYI